MAEEYIVVRGAAQNNLKGVDLRIPLGALIVVTGVSGSGKSSLAFDTIYSEGQRRYVETFSTYTRQFLDRMDRPRVDRIEGIPPAIAIDQTNPVRTSRSTVGTMTELNDHLKLLYARAAQLFCGTCGRPVRRETPDTIFEELYSTRGEGERITVTFPLTIPEGFDEEEVEGYLAAQGYRRIHRREGRLLEVVQDRVRLESRTRGRIVEDLEAALKYGRGQVAVYAGEGPSDPHRFSADLHCATCNIRYHDPVANLFSFNSPLGACETCRGFGRIIDIAFDLVVPDRTKTLAEGAVRPWQTESYRECQDDLIEFARRRSIPIDVAWEDLSDEQREWVLEGEGSWEDGLWYGVRRFFKWLETKVYRMHIRVLLSKYRAYRPCPACGGARLKPEALYWRLGGREGCNIHELAMLPISRCREFFTALKLPKPFDEATDLLLGEIGTRLQYLVDVGLGYLTLDRQSRTLSGGEVQRINLTTALGTSLVNALFVLDEPSIGLHPRDIGRLIAILHRLRDAGNTLIVVEHDPDVIRAADLVLDMGPGAGERGGEVVFFGTLERMLREGGTLTASYLRGDRLVLNGEEPGAGGDGGAGNEGALVPEGGSQTVKPAVWPGTGYVGVLGAGEHNLKDIDVRFPLCRLVCVTGVSGSGKSTLVEDVLYRALKRLKHRPVESPGRHRAIGGHDQIDDVVLVDQSPLGKTARSNPASYVGALDSIRRLFAGEPLARERGYTAGAFSFNSERGRCPTCGGSGYEHIEMQFLSDVYLRCPDCDGRRYRSDVLEVKLVPRGVDRGDGIEPRSGSQSQPDEYDEEENSETRLPVPKSIADVLDMTVREARSFFASYPEVLRSLEPLSDVGLDYLRLGQPVPTLSGGEAQRLKLAGHLTGTMKRRGSPGRTLFLFDEPTTGLHFDDIAMLLRAFRKLIASGHSIVVIEHNLDVIAAADWIIDLGPEGGEAGGTVLCEGSPAAVADNTESHTGRALRQRNGYLKGPVREAERSVAEGGRNYGETERAAHRVEATSVAKVREAGGRTGGLTSGNGDIRIRHAREHNLKGIDVRIPRDAFTVVTGVSGSGKSTLAFDILFSEGQRRYLESLNAYARQFVQPAARPDVDSVTGVPPTVAIEQRSSRGGRRSTVATMTEIYHFLRLLYARLGTQYCPSCDVAIQPQTSEAILSRIVSGYDGRRVGLYAPLVSARKGYYTDLASWAAGRGFSHLRVDGLLVPTRNWPRLSRYREHNIELPVGVTEVRDGVKPQIRALLDRALEFGKGVVYVGAENGQRSGEEAIFSIIRACPRCGRSFEELDPRLFSFNSKHGWCPRCTGTGLMETEHGDEQDARESWDSNSPPACPECGGRRLRSEALSVTFRNRSISSCTDMTVSEACRFFEEIKLLPREEEIARDVVAELRSRLSFLEEVGLSYLSLARSAPTLSGGEAQRIRLASQLGSNLRGVCYILDEPTIGLHVRDNRMLLDTLGRLKGKGNTVVVVEHDEETIRRAEHVVDLGPGGGLHGGRLVDEGTVAKLLKSRHSVTGRFLRHPLNHPLIVRDRPRDSAGLLVVSGARLHNLKDLRAEIPLGYLVCVTGVSGSGKSTLARDVLFLNLRRILEDSRSGRNRDSYIDRAVSHGAGLDTDNEPDRGGTDHGNPADRISSGLNGCSSITGWHAVGRVLEVDQSPIGKTPRSCPATYVGFWNPVRRLFAQLPEARMRGYGAARFSFNVSGGRCDECAGQGVKRIEMSFLPNVSVRCDVCGGARFNAETLAIRFKGRSIGDVLEMSVEEAADFFKAQPSIRHPLSIMREIGLGYLHLGQQSPTLSGGEAQRIKLVTELAKTRPGLVAGGNGGRSARTLYVLDEPTIGLHMADVEKLIRVLHRLVDAGNTVVVIEHNMDVIAEADWIIDLGPEGGDQGGRIVAEGPPARIARRRKNSHTARFLAEFLEKRRRE
jgi:excinuclease ABC subunit A